MGEYQYDPYWDIESENDYKTMRADLALEFGSRKTNKNKFACNDRMCGATDCETCHPGCAEELHE